MLSNIEVICLQEIFKRVLMMGIDLRCQLIDSSRAAIGNGAGIRALDIDFNGTIFIADEIISSQLESFIEGQATPRS